MAMNQKGTDRGTRGETGEKMPKGAIASDKSGEKSVKTKNGVAMGMADKTGTQEGAVGRRNLGSLDTGEFNGGRSEGVCYSHKRVKHDQD